MAFISFTPRSFLRRAPLYSLDARLLLRFKEPHHCNFYFQVITRRISGSLAARDISIMSLCFRQPAAAFERVEAAASRPAIIGLRYFRRTSDLFTGARATRFP